jgi:hypothetical protein
MRLEDRTSHATSGRGRQTLEARANCTTSMATAARGETIALPFTLLTTAIHACDCESDYVSSTCARARARFPHYRVGALLRTNTC